MVIGTIVTETIVVQGLNVSGVPYTSPRRVFVKVVILEDSPGKSCIAREPTGFYPFVAAGYVTVDHIRSPHESCIIHIEIGVDQSESSVQEIIPFLLIEIETGEFPGPRLRY